MEVKIYTLEEFAELVKVTSRTLRNWDKTGVFKARRSPTGKLFYTHEDFIRYSEGF